MTDTLENDRMGIADVSGTCFVAMPFQEPFERYFMKVFEPAIVAAGLKSTRADSIFRAGDVVRQMAAQILHARVVFAELSTINANVYYEIGLAHCLLKPTVLVAQSIEVVPFDLRGGRVILYDREDPFWGELLTSRITAALIETIEAPDLGTPTGIESALRDRKVRTGHGQEKQTESASEIYRSIESRLDQLQRSIEFSTRKVVPLSAQGDAMAQAEAARETIRLLLERGSAKDDIIRQVVGSGISQLWAEDAIDEIMRDA